MSKPFILEEQEQAQEREALLLELSRLLRRLFWLTLLWGWPLGMVFLRPNEFDFYQTFGT